MSLFDRLTPSPSPPRHYFTPDEIGRLHRLDDASAAGIDDQTWNDLLLEAYEDKLAPDASIFGRQLLHRRLRAGLDDDACLALRARMQSLMDDPARLDALDAQLRVLRHADVEVVDLLFRDAPPARPAWAGWLWLLPAALAASLLALVTLPFGWALTLAALAPLMALQMRYHRPLEAWAATIRALHALLRATSLLGKRGAALPDPLLAPFVARRGAAERLHVRLARSLATRMIPGAQAYIDWFAAANVAHYFKTAGLVYREREFLRACWLDCANLEADVVLALHLRGAFISGQNASGKSTLLRTVGLNLVAARAFGFCYADLACLPAVPVRASMQNEDSLAGGESLYMAELRRARELLDAAGQPPGICLIDEVFRGTNHLESVSAACAVLEQLAGRDLVLVSSHNLVLAPLLRERFVPFFIDTASGRPVLAPGVLANPNGIALLATQGFGDEVESRAREVARWLSSHLAES